MRVGILFENKSPLLGGGFTFQEDLLRALVNLHRETRHQFVLFCNPDYVDKHFGDLLRGAGIEILPERPSDLLERIALMANRSWPGLRKLRRWMVLPTRLERKFRAARVDFVWFMSMRSELLDIPYMTV